MKFIVLYHDGTQKTIDADDFSLHEDGFFRFIVSNPDISRPDALRDKVVAVVNAQFTVHVIPQEDPRVNGPKLVTPIDRPKPESEL